MEPHDTRPDEPDQQPVQEPTPAKQHVSPQEDRALRMGLPPDGGEEQHVATVRPALLRARPISTVLMGILPIAVTIGLLFTSVDLGQPVAYISLLVLAGVCWIALLVWWIRFRWTCSLYITNKRTIERRGLLSRSSDEVLHDHVRNINVDQSFVERILNIGSIGISSAGQSGTEIELDKFPNPDRVKEIIDAYRDDLGNRYVTDGE